MSIKLGGLGIIMKTRFFLIGLLVFPIIPAYASCATPPPILNEIGNFKEAHTIFVGKVIDVYHPHGEDYPGMAPDVFTFDVDYYLKGKLKDNDVISHHSSVGYDDFVEGQSYLVFAFGGIDEVGQCSPPIELSSAGPVLMLFYLWQYLPAIISAIVGAVIFVIWKKRR